MKPILKFYVPEIQSSMVDIWISFHACIQITQRVFVCIVIYFTTWNKRRFSIGKAFQLLPANCFHNITEDNRDFGIMSIFITDIMLPLNTVREILVVIFLYYIFSICIKSCKFYCRPDQFCVTGVYNPYNI
jgi:hypothetical protein